MKTSDLDALLAVVETARAELHPDLSADFLREVVLIEQRSTDDEAAALSALRKLVESTLRPGVT
jgi:hypothetical protein